MALNIGVWDFRHYSIGDALKEMVEGTRDFYGRREDLRGHMVAIIQLYKVLSCGGEIRLLI